MLLNALLLVFSSQCVWATKSEASLCETDAGLFRGSDKYDFAVVVPAAGIECFWHFAHQSGSFYLMYMPITATFKVMQSDFYILVFVGVAVTLVCSKVQWVTGMASDNRLLVTVISPQGVLMALKNEAVGQMSFLTEVTGFYRMCFGNHNNQFGDIRVFVNFGVIYEDSEESKRETEEEEKVLHMTLTSIEVSLQKLQNRIFHMWRHYSFARTRKGRDHHLLLSNLNYVTWWSATQSVVILLSGYLQLLVLKRLFHTDSSRPRC